ncbi:MAG: hypothetical protein IKJ55_03100 [Clostridia bacterium]|nr:hypothetical protein [Clostridia bacterium]
MPKYCEKCGKMLSDETRTMCWECTPVKQPVYNEQPMKWYKVFAYGIIWISAILNIVLGVTRMQELQYEKQAEQIKCTLADFLSPEDIASLQSLETIFGVVGILIGIASIYFGICLVLKKRAATFVWILYAIGVVISLAEYFAISPIFENAQQVTVGMMYYKLDFNFAQLIPALGSSVFFAVCNYRYFNNRKHLFNK